MGRMTKGAGSRVRLTLVTALAVAIGVAGVRLQASALVPEPPAAERASPDAAGCQALEPAWTELGIAIDGAGAGVTPGRVYSVSDGTLAVLVVVAAVDETGAATALDVLGSVLIDAAIVGSGTEATVRRFDPPALNVSGLVGPEEGAIDRVAFCYRSRAAAEVTPLPAGAAPRATVAARATATAASAATATFAAAAATAVADADAALREADARATEAADARATAQGLETAGAETAAAYATAETGLRAELTAVAQNEAALATTEAAAQGTAAALATREAVLVASVAAQATEVAALEATSAARAESAATADARAAATETAAAMDVAARATEAAGADATAAAEEANRGATDVATTTAEAVAAQATASHIGTVQAGRDAALVAAQTAVAAAQATGAALAAQQDALVLTATAVAPTATPTVDAAMPTSPAPAVLYRADEGTAFAGWTLPAGWTREGTLLVAGGGATGGWATPPFQVADLADYAVEAEVRIAGEAACAGNFGVGGRGTDAGYYAAGVEWRCGPVALLWAAQEPIANAAFDPGGEWRLYRLEVRGDTVRFLVDGRLILEATDERYRAGSEVGLWSNGVGLAVRGFAVMDLPSPP